MRIREKTCAALAAMMLLTAPAMAQTYVGTALVGDLARFSHSSFDGQLGDASGGEAIGFALRLGIGVGAAWGVEAEFARPSEITSTASPQLLAALEFPQLVGWPTRIDPGLVPGLGISITTRQRNTTLSTVAWARQDLTSRTALVYLGGLSFVRAANVTEYSFSFVRSLSGLLLPAADRVEFIAYGVRPVVGIEARIGLTDHIELVPGVRLAGLDNGWLIRPAVGLGWGF